MAKYCPIQKRKVVYLTCLECEYHGRCEQKNKDSNTSKENTEDKK